MLPQLPAKFWQRVTALFCTIGLACGGSGILPAVVVGIGQLDSDHHALVSGSGRYLEVRFHHLDDGSGHDEAVAAGEVSFKSGSDSHEDHVVRFVSEDNDSVLASAAPTPSSDLGGISLIEAELPQPIVLEHAIISKARPPPGELALIHCLRSVVLIL
jgi:hypothetical protein